MTPVSVTIKLDATNTHVIEGKLVAPGLAVGFAAIANPPYRWLVIHARSGLLLLSADNPECATAMAYELAATDIDWTAHATEFGGTSRIVNRVRVAHLANGSKRSNGRKATGDGLLDTSPS